MNTVTNIHLNGKSFQLEEAGYQSLHQYLEDAKIKLAGDPDAQEILDDLEQAIADKCSHLIKGDKNVITTAEITKIIEEMGQVEATHEASEKTGPSGTTGTAAKPPTKRLYRVKDGAVLGGVCKGIAAYFGTDVTIVRLLFIFFTLIGFSGVLAYIIAWIIVPKASTPSQIAEAYGRPVTAQDIVERSAGQLAIAADRLRTTDTTKWSPIAILAVVILILFVAYAIIVSILSGIGSLIIWPF